MLANALLPMLQNALAITQKALKYLLRSRHYYWPARSRTWEHALRAQPAAVALRTHQPIIVLRQRISAVEVRILHQRTHILERNNCRCVDAAAAAADASGTTRVELQQLPAVPAPANKGCCCSGVECAVLAGGCCFCQLKQDRRALPASRKRSQQMQKEEVTADAEAF
jgi:hypothetical protein